MRKELFFFIKVSSFFAFFCIIFIRCESEKQATDSYFQNGRIVIKPVFNETDTGHFIVDTGAELISVASSFFSNVLKPKPILGKPNFSAGPGSKKIKRVVYDSLSFRYKSKYYNKLMFSVFNYEDFFIDNYDGIIGVNFLADKILLLDFENENFDFIQRSSIKEYAELDSIPISLSRGKPCIKASITLEDSSIITGDFIIDTGFSGFLMLWQHIAETQIREDAISKSLIMEGKNGNISGDIRIKIFNARSFESSIFKAKHPIIAYEEYENPFAVKNLEDYHLGIIGNNLLSNYLIILDYPNKKMYFKQYKDIEQNEFYQAGFELGRNKKKEFLVQALIYDSPADSADIRIGDILLEADGLEANRQNYLTIIKKLKTPGTVTLKLKRRDSIFIKKVPVRKLL